MRSLANGRALDAEKRARRSAGLSRAERLLAAIGLDDELVEAMVGDLAEEFALRSARDGRSLARVWYVSEALRSAPHLIGCALRRGEPRARLRLAASLLAVALTVTVTATVTAILLRDGPPARLIANGADATEGIVVNNMRHVQLQMRVLDKRGHLLASQPLRYRWLSGAPMAVSPLGVVACTRPGDAIVRASLGAIATEVALRCRPVKELRASTWIDFVAGDRPRDIPFVAIGVDGQPVMQLRGAVRVIDSSVAVLEGTTVRPRAVGSTAIAVDVGDRTALIQVIVHELVRSFEGLRSDQRYVARAVRLARGDTVRWSLPNGVFWIKYLPRRAGEAPPTVTLHGAVVCTPGDGIRVYRMLLDEYGTYCMVRGVGGASVSVGHGAAGADVVEGSIALERVGRI